MSRCSVKMIIFSSRNSGSSRTSRSLLELRLLARRRRPAAPARAGARPAPARRPVRPGDGDDAAERLVLGHLVLLLAVLGALLVGGLALEDVVGVCRAAAAGAASCSAVIWPDLDVVDQRVELAASRRSKRAQQGVGRAGQAALEDAHGQPGGRAVQDARPVVVCADVVGGLVVERLLADLALGQVVAERVRDPLRVDAACRRSVTISSLVRRMKWRCAGVGG